MGFQSCDKRIDPLEQALIDDSLIFVRLDLVLPLEALLVDLVLLGANERLFIDVRVDFDVRVVAQFESVLELSALRFSLVVWRGNVSC